MATRYTAANTDAKEQEQTSSEPCNASAPLRACGNTKKRDPQRSLMVQHNTVSQRFDFTSLPCKVDTAHMWAQHHDAYSGTHLKAGIQIQSVPVRWSKGIGNEGSTSSICCLCINLCNSALLTQLRTVLL